MTGGTNAVVGVCTGIIYVRRAADDFCGCCGRSGVSRHCDCALYDAVKGLATGKRFRKWLSYVEVVKTSNFVTVSVTTETLAVGVTVITVVAVFCVATWRQVQIGPTSAEFAASQLPRADCTRPSDVVVVVDVRLVVVDVLVVVVVASDEVVEDEGRVVVVVVVVVPTALLVVVVVDELDARLVVELVVLATRLVVVVGVLVVVVVVLDLEVVVVPPVELLSCRFDIRWPKVVTVTVVSALFVTKDVSTELILRRHQDLGGLEA